MFGVLGLLWIFEILGKFRNMQDTRCIRCIRDMRDIRGNTHCLVMFSMYSPRAVKHW